MVKKPTSKSTWKSFEREVAKHFGTKRVPLSGSNSGHNTNSDTLHPKLYIECKVRGKSAIWTLFEDTRNKAKVEKNSHYRFATKGGKGYLLVIRPEDLHKISKIQLESTEVSE